MFELIVIETISTMILSISNNVLEGTISHIFVYLYFVCDNFVVFEYVTYNHLHLSFMDLKISVLFPTLSRLECDVLLMFNKLKSVLNSMNK